MIQDKAWHCLIPAEVLEAWVCRADWAILGAVALTIFPVLELVKWLERRGWFGVPPDGSRNR